MQKKDLGKIDLGFLRSGARTEDRPSSRRRRTKTATGVVGVAGYGPPTAGSGRRTAELGWRRRQSRAAALERLGVRHAGERWPATRARGAVAKGGAGC